MTMETTKTDSNLLCRVCLRAATKKYKNLVQEKLSCERPITLLQAFEEVTGVQVLNSDPSTIICCNCYKDLNKAYQFREEARKSDNLLKNSNKNNESIKENWLQEKPELNNEVIIKYEDTFDTNIHEEEVIDENWLQEEYLNKDENPINSDNEEKNYELPQFSTKSILESNLVEVKLNSYDELFFTCDICFETFTIFKQLQRHMKTNHLYKKVYSCPEGCGIEFTSNSRLGQHLKAQHLDRDKPNKVNKRTICEICGTTMKKHGIKEHMRTVHRTDRPYFCNYEGCGRSFKCANVLSQHIACVHSDEKKFNCSQCSKSFKMSTTLHAHVRRIHTMRKCIKCDQCEKYFLTDRERQLHINGIHLGLRNYGCTFCESTFKTRYHLNRHLRRMHPDGWKDLTESGKIVVRLRSKVKKEQ